MSAGDGMKIAVVGGGSTYTPELVSGLSGERDRLDVRELWLVDPDADRREVVGGLARRMLAAQGFHGRLEVTDELAPALDGADTVLLQLRVGGQTARLSDETVPHRCSCIGQETTGAGGFAKALRTVPVVLDIAERVRELAASDAWIIDFTNPVGIVVRALLDAGHRAIGLCNVAIGFQREIAAIYGVSPDAVLIDQVGLNHLTWIRSVRIDGRDVLAEILERHAERLEGQTGLPAELMRLLGVLPSYYLRYFYMHDLVLADQQHEPARALVVSEIEHELMQQYRDPALTTKPAALARRGGAFYSDAAIQLVGSLAADSGDVQVVDIRAGGAMPGFAPDDVVELPARITSNGAQPLAQSPLAPELLGLARHVAAYERLTAQAAVTRERDTMRRALLAHPLIGQYPRSDELLDLLEHAERERTDRVGARA
jgi:6-phospho-beta-glucosidase